MSAKQIDHALQFIFDVAGTVKPSIQFLPPDKNASVPLQLDIQSINAPAEKSMTAPQNFSSTEFLQKINKLARQNENKINPKNVIVVIDAGHGGKDSGALGAHGSKEKNIVLSIAEKIANEINQHPPLRAVLTRNGDYFVPLSERLKLARKAEADVFVSIHADAGFRASAKGASVYALSENGASSVAARWLAIRENHSELDDVSLNSLQDQSSLLRSVLIDLAQTVTMQDNMLLGNNILDALDKVSALHHSRIERAPFLVLKSPDIPSVLIETGFISNPKEERRLQDPTYQNKLALAIWRGIDQYISHRKASG